MTKELQFKCPDCGGITLEEVMDNMEQRSNIESVDENSFVSYGNNIRTYNGKIKGYECESCGLIIGNKVNTPEKLVKWIKENCKQD